MPKPTLAEFSGLPDPLLSESFELLIPNLPAGADAASLRLQCTQVSLPSMSIDPVISEHSHLVYAGQARSAHDMQIVINETRLMVGLKSLSQWMTYARRRRDQLGHFKSEYARNGILNVFDQKGTVIESYNIVGAWPSNLPEIAFDRTSSQIVTIPATLQIDYWTPRDNFATAN